MQILNVNIAIDNFTNESLSILRLIQQTIRSQLDEVTCLTIAHRLHTIMDADKVCGLATRNMRYILVSASLCNVTCYVVLLEVVLIEVQTRYNPVRFLCE